MAPDTVNPRSAPVVVPGWCRAVGVLVWMVRPRPSVKVVVVKKDPALTEAAVLAYCKEHMTGYKRPRSVEFRTELPKTPVGKILRRALRDEELAKIKAAKQG